MDAGGSPGREALTATAVHRHWEDAYLARKKTARSSLRKPVGLLWDSVSNNVGDRAIGMVMRRFLEREGVSFDTADPFSYDPADYSTLIVGGGELIRPRGDPFYDRFRVRGAHILNTIGVHQPDDLEYLNEYRLVTVRSQADKKILDPVVAGVKVRPCVTLVMGDYFEKAENPQIPRIVAAGETIGLHLNLAISHLLPSLLPVLQSLQQRDKLLLFPFTLYQQDGRIHEAIRRWLPDTPVSPFEDPADIYHAIGRMRALVCVSLHGTIFAYAQNVPVLAYPTVPKISHFLEERGLGEYLFHNAGEMQAKLENILAAPPDFSAAFERDRKTVRSHLKEIARMVRTPLRARKAAVPASGLQQSLAASIKSYHTRWMEYLTLWSHNFAEGLETQFSFAQKEEHVRSLQAQVDGWKAETETRDRAVQALTLQALEKEGAVQGLILQAAEKDRTIQALISQATETDRTIQALISQAAETDRTIQALESQAAEKDQSIRALTTEGEEKDRILRGLTAESAVKDQSIQTLSSELMEIKGSTAWSIIHLMWRVRLFLLPHGSRRELIGVLAFRSIQVIRKEGISAFLRKARERMRRTKDAAP
jgi:hypothetical protein